MADRQPRPGLSVLLTGRFRVSRPALLARPAGPVAGVAVAPGACARLQRARAGLDDAELRRRVERANALGRPGCPLVEVADAPPVRWLAAAGWGGLPRRRPGERPARRERQRTGRGARRGRARS